MVHVVGEAAENPPKVGDKVQGITVQRKSAEAMRVMTPDDLGVYNKVSVGQIIQRQHMALSTNFSKCRCSLSHKHILVNFSLLSGSCPALSFKFGHSLRGLIVHFITYAWSCNKYFVVVRLTPWNESTHQVELEVVCFCIVSWPFCAV